MAFTKLPPEVLRLHKGVSFTGITTPFFCYDGEGNVFLTKRSKNTRDEHGKWDPGAGGLKHGESVEGTMRRELMEEYGVEPLKTDFIGYFDAFRALPDGQPTHWIAMCFAVKVDRAKVRVNEPDNVDDSGWFRLDEFPRPLHSQFDLFMSLHGEKLKAIITSKNS